MIKNSLLLMILLEIFLAPACRHKEQTGGAVVTRAAGAEEWKQRFDEVLPLLGHRNWIIVADKAYPQQNAPGIEYLNTHEPLLPVLDYVLNKVNSSGHVRPVVYRDRELDFITEEQSKGINDLRAQSLRLFGNQPLHTLLHDSVFSRLDAGSKLFKILVLKTDETIPYTSVFLQLDCAYWNSEKEAQLRKAMGVR